LQVSRTQPEVKCWQNEAKNLSDFNGKKSADNVVLAKIPLLAGLARPVPGVDHTVGLENRSNSRGPAAWRRAQRDTARNLGYPFVFPIGHDAEYLDPEPPERRHNPNSAKWARIALKWILIRVDVIDEL
jgi:hypothetical protein